MLVTSPTSPDQERSLLPPVLWATTGNALSSLPAPLGKARGNLMKKNKKKTEQNRDHGLLIDTILGAFDFLKVVRVMNELGYRDVDVPDLVREARESMEEILNDPEDNCWRQGRLRAVKEDGKRIKLEFVAEHWEENIDLSDDD